MDLDRDSLGIIDRESACAQATGSNKFEWMRCRFTDSIFLMMLRVEAERRNVNLYH